MFKNLTITAFRNILKNRLFSIINILGLGISISISLLLFQYVKFERSFDTFYSEPENIYRLNLAIQKDDQVISRSARTSPAVGQAILDEIPEVTDFTRSVIMGESIASYEDNHFREKNILLADPSFFEIFEYEIIKGSPEKDMAEPMNIYISESVAQSLFDEEDPINKKIKLNSENLDGSAEFVIKGVFRDVNVNSHLRPNILLSYVTLHSFIGNQIDLSWEWNNLYTYIRTEDGSDLFGIQSKVDDLVSRKIGKKVEERNEKWIYELQPVSDIHTNLEYTDEFESGVDGSLLKYYVVVAFFILLIAYVNFINLYTAKSAGRAKEIAVRKVSGAKRSHLLLQFLGEAFVLNLFGVLMAATILQFSEPIFRFAGINSLLADTSITSLIVPITAILILGTLISGIYPAIVMSGWGISLGLKNNKKIQFGGFEIRRGLIVVQFVISSLLIAGTLTIYRQLEYVNNYDLGFDIEQKLVIKAPKVGREVGGQQLGSFRNKLLESSDIVQVSAMDEIPGNEIYFKTNEFRRDENESSNMTFTFLNVEEHYFDLFDINFVAGRNFQPEMDSSRNTCIINETAVEVLGFSSPEEATNTKVFMRTFEVEIIGVVEDFHQEGLKKQIFPQLFSNENYKANYIVASVNTERTRESLQFIEDEFKSAYPESPFEYYFLDEYYNKQYQSEELFSKAFKAFSFLAIFIACIGLIGISYQSLIEKTKEIGIRKILGASTKGLFFKLSKDYLVLVLMGYLISMPIAIYYYDSWLNQFSARISFGLWFYILPGLSLVLAVVISIGVQTIKAANSNPVESLRYE